MFKIWRGQEERLHAYARLPGTAGTAAYALTVEKLLRWAGTMKHAS